MGAQDPAKYRIVLEGAGDADGAYGIGDVNGDDAWSAEDPYVLNRSTLGLSAPLTAGNLTVRLQYADGGWRTLVRTKPAD